MPFKSQSNTGSLTSALFHWHLRKGEEEQGRVQLRGSQNEADSNENTRQRGSGVFPETSRRDPPPLSLARWAVCWAWTTDRGSRPVSISLPRILPFESRGPMWAEAGWSLSSLRKSQNMWMEDWIVKRICVGVYILCNKA